MIRVLLTLVVFWIIGGFLAGASPVKTDQRSLMPDEFIKLETIRVSFDAPTIATITNTNEFHQFLAYETFKLYTLGPSDEIPTAPMDYFVAETQRELRSDHLFAARWISFVAATLIARRLSCDHDPQECSLMSETEKKDFVGILDRLSFDAYIALERGDPANRNRPMRDLCVAMSVGFGLYSQQLDDQRRGVDAVSRLCKREFPESQFAFDALERSLTQSLSPQDALYIQEEVQRLSHRESWMSVWIGLLLYNQSVGIADQLYPERGQTDLPPYLVEFLGAAANTRYDRSVQIEDGAFLKAAVLKVKSKYTMVMAEHASQARLNARSFLQHQAALYRTDCFRIMPSGFEC